MKKINFFTYMLCTFSASSTSICFRDIKHGMLTHAAKLAQECVIMAGHQFHTSIHMRPFLNTVYYTSHERLFIAKFSKGLG
ncbi:hypothetical protein Ancab_018194 [Ancistrocladus abbreviatus]